MQKKPETFAARLTHFREQAGLSVSELAAKVGITRQSLYSVEGGKCSPSWETVCALADALRVGVNDLRGK